MRALYSLLFLMDPVGRALHPALTGAARHAQTNWRRDDRGPRLAPRPGARRWRNSLPSLRPLAGQNIRTPRKPRGAKKFFLE